MYVLLVFLYNVLHIDRILVYEYIRLQYHLVLVSAVWRFVLFYGVFFELLCRLPIWINDKRKRRHLNVLFQLNSATYSKRISN